MAEQENLEEAQFCLCLSRLSRAHEKKRNNKVMSFYQLLLSRMKIGRPTSLTFFIPVKEHMA